MPGSASEPAAIAVSLGDPAGVGPELVAAAWAARGPDAAPFFAVGGPTLLKAAAAARGITLPVIAIADASEAFAAFAHGLPVLGDLDGDYRPGAPDLAGARLALASLDGAARLAAAGIACAITTAPVAKARLAEIGFSYPGQTEFVAAACGVEPDDAVMMLAGPSLRAIPLTVHIALADVPGAIDTDLIVRRARIASAALARDFGLSAPRLAIAALNPHAGEEGRMGHEDAAIIAPAVTRLRAEGVDATGPHPADALFSPRGRQGFDVALCMYHDQALIPTKALDFDEGVNVTLGLPTIRTSPDHGTAFAIAGKGLAHPGATIAALAMAGACARHRRRGGGGVG